MTAAALDHIVISPASATIAAGGSQAYTAEGFDSSDNSLGDVTASTTFSIAPNGSCSGDDVHRDRGRVAHGDRQRRRGDGHRLAERDRRAALDHLVLSPASATITAGGSQAYTAEGRDQYDNSLGDVTASTTFSIAPNGSCTGASCTASVAGAHTVTGTKSGKTGTASLQVTAGAARPHRDQPRERHDRAGGSQAYTAEGFDASNNSLGDVTALDDLLDRSERVLHRRESAPRRRPGRTRSPGTTAARRHRLAERDRRAPRPPRALARLGDDHRGRFAGLHGRGTRPVRQLARRRDRDDDVLDRAERVLHRRELHRLGGRARTRSRGRRRGKTGTASLQVTAGRRSTTS